MFGEILTTREVEFCECVRAELAGVSWAEPLLGRIPPRDQLNYACKPYLFELRFAGEIHRRGLTAKYEHPTGIGDSTVDFRILHEGTEWLVELVSILTSNAVRGATTEQEPFFWTILSSDAADPTHSEEGEIILVQQKIGEKVQRAGKPIKFPTPQPRSYNVILADARGFGITGGDLWDYREIAYGPAGLPGQVAPFRHCWKEPDGAVTPILGLFDPANEKQRAAGVVRERVHFLGFCNDQVYEPGSVPLKSYYLSNPTLFEPADGGAQAYSGYPLRAPGEASG